jgi:hypothetical protein
MTRFSLRALRFELGVLAAGADVDHKAELPAYGLRLLQIALHGEAVAYVILGGSSEFRALAAKPSLAGAANNVVVEWCRRAREPEFCR